MEERTIYQIFFTALDDVLAEYQIDSFGNIEKGWRVKPGHPVINLLKAYLTSFVPNSVDDLVNVHDIISIHPADGITYKNDTIVVSYATQPTDAIRKKYGLGNVVPVVKTSKEGYVGEFTIKYDLIERKGFAKVCDSDTVKYLMCPMPEGTIWGSALGVGVHFTGDERENYADFYFVNNDRDLMRSFFGSLYPEYEEDFTPVNRGYCVTVDQRTGKAVKLKRYIYWDDKELANLSLI